MKRIGQQRQIGVDVRIDEARGDHPVGDVEPPARLGAAERSDGRDPVAPNPHIRAKPRAPGPVDHAAPCQDDIEHECSSFAHG